MTNSSTQITKDQIEKTAQLARLNLSDEQIEKFSAQISQVLEAFEGLEEVEVSDQEEFNHYLLLDEFKNKLREDKVLESTKTTKGQIGKLFPQKGGSDNRYLKVKKVF
jgi:aspartyl-tRNA(Asn)/glutamyl-tRNA(Gln) amidotransferase subunit C